MGKPQSRYTGPTHHEVICEIAPLIITYVDWYAENGYFLPDEFANNPSEWAQILRDIEAAMKLLLVNPTPKDEEDKALLYNGIEKYYTYSRYLFLP